MAQLNGIGASSVSIHEEAPVKIGSEVLAGFPKHPFGINPAKERITHCQTQHNSGAAIVLLGV